jgi:hypothetical protein
MSKLTFNMYWVFQLSLILVKLSGTEPFCSTSWWIIMFPLEIFVVMIMIFLFVIIFGKKSFNN